MEWHDVDKVDGRWTTSTETFKTQLQQMYDAGLRPVTVADFVAGRFNVEAGKTPVVLTFDDSFKSHLFFGPNGKPDPNSVVGMLENFAASHKGWKATAVFYVYYPAPFRESALVSKKLHYLVDNGFEVGNHSLGHDNLSTFDDEGVQKSLGGLQKKIDETLPKYRLASLALPYGTWPKNRALAVTGDFEGKRYWHDVIFLVGDMPAIGPFDERYDPTKVMRVQAYEFDKWMKWMQMDGRRFVSDGDPKTIAYPQDTKFTVRKVSGLHPVSYSPS